MTTATTSAAPVRRRFRGLRWLGLALLVPLLLAGLALWWLLGTSGGLRFALARATAATDGALSVQQARGRLAGPLTLRDVRYRDGKGLDIRLQSARLDLSLWPLLHRQLHVLDLQADGIQVDLPAGTAKSDDTQSSFSLQPPIDMQLDHVHVGALAIRQAGQPLFVSNRLDLAGAWTHQGLRLRKLELDAPDGHAALDGTVAIGGDYRGDGHASFAWKLGGNDYAGSLGAHSDGKLARLKLSMTAPTPIELQLDLTQGGSYPWTARLDAPRFDPKPLLGESSLKAVALSLQGSGDKRGGTLNGHVGLDSYQLQLKPLRARFSDDFKTLTLEQLQLGSPQVKGNVAIKGELQLDAKPISGTLDIRWQDLELPADLAGQLLASHGELSAHGSAQQFHVEGAVSIGPPGKLADLKLDLDGTQQRIALHALELKQARGGMQVHGDLTLQPAFAWNVQALASKLDPGQLLANWNGSLDFDLANSGQLVQQHPEGSLDIRKLTGQLRQRQIRGNGKLHLSASEVLDGRLDLASGGSTIRIDARAGDSNDAKLDLAIASLGDWLPNAGGRLNGNFAIRGKAPALSINGTLGAQSLSYQQQKIQHLQLILGVPDISHPSGKLDLQTQGVVAAGMDFQSVDLHAEGSQASHRLTLDARGQQLSARLALDGSEKNDSWTGSLTTLDLAPQNLPPWRLQKTTTLRYADGTISMSELCLSAGDPLLCITGKQDKPGNLDASYRLRQLPLALITTAIGSADLPVVAAGSLQGDGTIHRSAAGALTGNASITSAQGTVTYADHPEQPLANYRNLALTARLSPAQQEINLHADLKHGGRLDGQMSISGARQALAGQLSLRLDDLGIIELFTSELAEVKGQASGDFRFGGTLSQPQVTGQANISDFAAEVPSAGLKLVDGHLVLATTDAKVFRINGGVKSGQGGLLLDGTAGLGTDAQTVITIKGSHFTAADIPAAKVVISPNLTIRQSRKGIDVGGQLGMDSADLHLDKLPGAGATRASSDVVVVDEKQQEQQREQLPITASVTVNLGDKTHLDGMGLNGNIQGQLVVSERPGRATTGQGQIAVSGTYRAYGQNLKIERGQLLFASTPIDNPGLNIRAVRKLNPNATIDEGQEVGLYVSGTAKRPILTVFSSPVMEQSDALSYLITGKPLSGVKGGEGNMVSAAAQALGSAGGDLLAKRIGSHLGVDDIGVSSSDALNGSSAFTVGKYLSPRLYLSYGVGLFEPGQVITLRYLLSLHWNFEAQNATDFSRASLNYRIEK
jgi:translocation and assembly module TamB